MGDRTYMEIVCRREDSALFDVLGFRQQDWRSDLPPDAVFLVDEEANYGHDSEMARLAEQGVVFCGRHDEGGDYHAACIASDGARYCRVDTLHGDGRPYVPVDPDGTVNDEDRRAATEYYLVESEARRVLGIEDTIFSGQA